MLFRVFRKTRGIPSECRIPVPITFPIHRLPCKPWGLHCKLPPCVARGKSPRSHYDGPKPPKRRPGAAQHAKRYSAEFDHSGSKSRADRRLPQRRNATFFIARARVAFLAGGDPNHLCPRLRNSSLMRRATMPLGTRKLEFAPKGSAGFDPVLLKENRARRARGPAAPPRLAPQLRRSSLRLRRAADPFYFETVFVRAPWEIISDKLPFIGLISLLRRGARRRI